MVFPLEAAGFQVKDGEFVCVNSREAEFPCRFVKGKNEEEGDEEEEEVEGEEGKEANEEVEGVQGPGLQVCTVAGFSEPHWSSGIVSTLLENVRKSLHSTCRVRTPCPQVTLHSDHSPRTKL